MADVLSELVVEIIADASKLKKAIAESEKDVKGLGKATEKETRSIKESFLEIGKTATVMGASITTAMGLMIRSFVKTGSELSDLSLSTGISVKALAGLKYAAEQNGASLGTVTMAVRRVSAAMQDAKDGLAETKRAFDRMGVSLQELEGLKPEDQFMKIASAIAQIPDPMTRAATAQDLFGRSGMDMLPMLSQGAAGLRKMMDEGVKLTGWSTEAATLADALGDAFDTLKTAMTGVFNVIGASLAPALKNIANTLIDITGGVVEWTKAHPGLVKAISTATIVVGLFATGIGLASIAVRVLGTTTNLYFGGILIAIGALVTGLVLLIDWFNRAGNAQKKLAEEQKSQLEKQMADDKAYFAQKKQQVDTNYADTIQKIREEYGIYESANKSKMDLARNATDEEKQELQKQLANARTLHDKKIDMLQREYDEKIRTLNAEADSQIQSIQGQIDAIDDLTEAEDTANRIAELQARVRNATTAEERMAAQQELDRFLLLQQRDAEKEALRAQIQAIRESTQLEADRLQKELDAQRENYIAQLGLLQSNLQLETEALDIALLSELKRLDEERIAKETLEAESLRLTLHRIAQEEASLRNTYDTRLNETVEWVKRMNAETAKLEDRTITVTTVERTISDSGGVNQSGGFGSSPYAPGFAHGGIVTRPTLALVGEAGPEAVVPLDDWGMPSIMINIDSFTANSPKDVDTLADKIVTLIRARTGLK